MKLPFFQVDAFTSRVFGGNPAGVYNGNAYRCQGFSEAGAGSDLAALRTRATRRGDRYVGGSNEIQRNLLAKTWLGL